MVAWLQNLGWPEIVYCVFYVLSIIGNLAYFFDSRDGHNMDAANDDFFGRNVRRGFGGNALIILYMFSPLTYILTAIYLLTDATFDYGPKYPLLMIHDFLDEDAIYLLPIGLSLIVFAL